MNTLLTSLLRSRSGRSHVTLPVPTRLLETDIHSFLGVLRFCLLGPMSLSFSCHCIRCTNHRREHSQESHTLIGLFPRKECMSVWSSRVGTGSVTWLRPERLRRRLVIDRLRIVPHSEKLWPRAWTCCPRSQFFPIRTSQPANNVYIEGKIHYTTGDSAV